MEESMLKTSWRQRLLIAAIAAVLLISSIAVYVAVVMSGALSDSSSSTKELDDLITEYTDKETEIANLLSKDHFERLSSYRSHVQGFNATAANNNGLQYTDVTVGNGAEITAENTNYYAYYIGWCADESIFDSSFDDADNPTSLRAPLDVSKLSLIEGWSKGMIGAKIGGTRIITIPGELAYGDSQEICGGKNSPLKFLVNTVEISEEAQKLYADLDDIYNRYLEAYYKNYTYSTGTGA